MSLDAHRQGDAEEVPHRPGLPDIPHFHCVSAAERQQAAFGCHLECLSRRARLRYPAFHSLYTCNFCIEGHLQDAT